MTQQVTVLGATGSIGVSTLDVIAQHPGRYQVFALTANRQHELLLKQCQQFNPVYAVLADESMAEKLQIKVRDAGLQTEVLAGADALAFVSSHEKVDAVMAAIVGAAGLQPTLAAVNAGKKVLLANKESLVMAGQLFMDAVNASGSALLPIDSEHNAMFQCLPGDFSRGLLDVGVSRILLTGSGGPFRTFSSEQLLNVTPEQACAHPNWSMGQKISVDSATLMNKGLELIEACWLFGTSPDHIDVVIHPQSIIHSMVQYSDGSTLAQMGNPDMRTPIAYGLSWPERISSGVSDLNMFDVLRLDFERPDKERFPCLALAEQAFSIGKTAAVALNAANEIAVEAFLQRQIGFMDIPRINAAVMADADLVEPTDITVVIEADKQARELAQRQIG